MIIDYKDDINFLSAAECQQMENVANFRFSECIKETNHDFNH